MQWKKFLRKKLLNFQGDMNPQFIALTLSQDTRTLTLENVGGDAHSISMGPEGDGISPIFSPQEREKALVNLNGQVRNFLNTFQFQSEILTIIFDDNPQFGFWRLEFSDRDNNRFFQTIQFTAEGTPEIGPVQRATT